MIMSNIPEARAKLAIARQALATVVYPANRPQYPYDQTSGGEQLKKSYLDMYNRTLAIEQRVAAGTSTIEDAQAIGHLYEELQAELSPTFQLADHSCACWIWRTLEPARRALWDLHREMLCLPTASKHLIPLRTY